MNGWILLSILVVELIRTIALIKYKKQFDNNINTTKKRFALSMGDALNQHAEAINKSLKGNLGYYFGKNETKQKENIEGLEEITDKIAPFAELLKNNGSGGNDKFM